MIGERRLGDRYPDGVAAPEQRRQCAAVGLGELSRCGHGGQLGGYVGRIGDVDSKRVEGRQIHLGPERPAPVAMSLALKCTLPSRVAVMA